ncbi:hypothetical protein ACFO3U_08120 [Flavobacterium ponti]|uniref:DUF4878 domain-containing protein n=1 Tax=Flavobacterium ponti TaxID=665133 RepID=A0ABV9P310_9FLAO
MKKPIFLLILFSFYSCNSNKAIINYMIQNEQVEDIIIIKEKLSPKNTINILRGIGIANKTDSVTKFNGSKTYSLSDFNNLYTKYKNDTIKEDWKLKDFKKLNVLLIDDFFNYLKESNNKKINDEAVYYSLSKPLFLDNKEKVFFYINKSIGMYNEFSKVVVMKKINGKWKIIEEIDNYEIF